MEERALLTYKTGYLNDIIYFIFDVSATYVIREFERTLKNQCSKTQRKIRFKYSTSFRNVGISVENELFTDMIVAMLFHFQ